MACRLFLRTVSSLFSYASSQMWPLFLFSYVRKREMACCRSQDAANWSGKYVHSLRMARSACRLAVRWNTSGGRRDSTVASRASDRVSVCIVLHPEESLRSAKTRVVEQRSGMRHSCEATAEGFGSRLSGMNSHQQSCSRRWHSPTMAYSNSRLRCLSLNSRNG
jgi:hypothetical protein